MMESNKLEPSESMTAVRFSLSRHLMLCERNYAMLMRLLRQARAHRPRLALKVAAQRGPDCLLVHRSSSHWSDVLQLSQAARLHQKYPPLSLTVRLCHDFYVSEITHFQGKRPPMPGFAAAHSPADEKLQQSLFLNQWLREGLDLGRCQLQRAIRKI